MGTEVDADDGVRLGGVAYVQVPTSKFAPPASGHPCYWCCAWSNMRLCDALCPHCKDRFVFIRQDARRYV